MARAVSDRDIETVNRQLREAYDACDCAGDDRAADALSEIVQYLVPFQAREDASIHAIRRHLRDTGAKYVEILCTQEIVAEIFMAGAETRRTHLRDRNAPDHYPAGK